MKRLTKAQKQGILKIYRRMQGDDEPTTLTYLQFRRKAQIVLRGECIMVPYARMWIGIERDGYAHS